MTSTKLEIVKTQWTFARGLTLDFMESLTESDLAYSPGGNLGPLWKQFRHVGSVQECYMEALITRQMRFEYRDKNFNAAPTKALLLAYLRALNTELIITLDSLDWEQTIRWSGDDQPKVLEHLLRLVNHETLHHGEWIVYLRLLGKDCPESWRAWGV